jgi:hypothetical protein
MGIESPIEANGWVVPPLPVVQANEGKSTPHPADVKPKERESNLGENPMFVRMVCYILSKKEWRKEGLAEFNLLRRLKCYKEMSDYDKNIAQVSYPDVSSLPDEEIKRALGDLEKSGAIEKRVLETEGVIGERYFLIDEKAFWKAQRKDTLETLDLKRRQEEFAANRGRHYWCAILFYQTFGEGIFSPAELNNVLFEKWGLIISLKERNNLISYLTKTMGIMRVMGRGKYQMISSFFTPDKTQANIPEELPLARAKTGEKERTKKKYEEWSRYLFIETVKMNRSLFFNYRDIETTAEKVEGGIAASYWAHLSRWARSESVGYIKNLIVGGGTLQGQNLWVWNRIPEEWKAVLKTEENDLFNLLDEEWQVVEGGSLEKKTLAEAGKEKRQKIFKRLYCLSGGEELKNNVYFKKRIEEEYRGKDAVCLDTLMKFLVQDGYGIMLGDIGASVSYQWTEQAHKEFGLDLEEYRNSTTPEERWVPPINYENWRKSGKEFFDISDGGKKSGFFWEDDICKYLTF